MDPDIRDAFIEVCSSGARDISDHIRSLLNMLLKEQVVEDYCAMLDFYDDHTTNAELYENTNLADLDMSHMYGHFIRLDQGVAKYDKHDPMSILIIYKYIYCLNKWKYLQKCSTT
jgi:hypothetical protein